MPKTLPEYLTVNEATGLLINFPESIKAGSVSLSEFLDNATPLEPKEQSLGPLFFYRQKMAEEIRKALDTELEKIRKDEGYQSDLIVDASYGDEKISSTSLCYWAATHLFIEIPGASPPKYWRKADSRSHNTPLLAFIDDLIGTFYEQGGEHYSSEAQKNQVIIAWAEENYPELSELSNKVQEAVCTITRPSK